MVPIEIVRVIPFVLTTLKIPINLYKGHKKLKREMKNGLETLLFELESLMHDLESNEEDWKSYDEVRLTELVYDIEDFAQGLWIPEASGPLLSAIGMNPAGKYVNCIEVFKEKIKLLKRPPESIKSKSRQGGSSSSANKSSSEPAASSAAGGCTREESLVGIDKPKKVILDLLKKPTASGDLHRGRDAEQRPKVISIVGCRGVGKTALAKAVYNHYVAGATSHDFDCVAWVEATGYSDKMALLTKIREKVQADLARRASSTLDLTEGDGTATLPDLNGMLAGKRYLIFIDDVHEAEVWDDIVPDFPEHGKSSMLIVTTSIHSVANAYSSGSYVYTMQCLSLKQSRDLFWRHVYPSGSKNGGAHPTGAERILSSCDGLPLALISVARHLKLSKGRSFDHDDCDRVSKELGELLVGGEATGFRELTRKVGQCYEGLSYFHKTCLLSLSIFPKNHPIKRKSLLRRLIAERLVAGDGRKCLDELINRCIVEPVQISSCSKDIKSCRVNGGVMLEFIIYMSQLTNLVTLIRDEDVVRNDKCSIRRLSVQSSTQKMFHEVGLSGIRSLTIFSDNHLIPSKETSKLFKKDDCKFLRLLDLEGCWGLDDELFRGICELVYLKYLSLRKTDVKKIPQEIKKLQCLQTLDVRETREINLPIQVIMLPKLAFLFGEFVLPEMSTDTEKFLKEKSELHTLGELVVNKEGFDHIILEAKHLRKVKVRCTDTGGSKKPQTSSKLSKVIQKKSSVGTEKDFVLSLQSRFTSLNSVSIDSSQLSGDILASLEKEENSSTICHMKLRGQLERLPCIGTLRQLNNLRKLQLSYTRLASKELSPLQHLPDLEYLKLLDNQESSWGGSFVVLEDGFPCLRRLCFQASKLPKLEFYTGSMKELTSLQLLCPNISQMQGVEEISKSTSHIASLNEVILHASATPEIVKAWETAVKRNSNRPCVKKQ